MAPRPHHPNSSRCPREGTGGGVVQSAYVRVCGVDLCTTEGAGLGELCRAVHCMQFCVCLCAVERVIDA